MPASKVSLCVVLGRRYRGVNEILTLLAVTQRGLVVTDVSGQPIHPIFKGQAV